MNGTITATGELAASQRVVLGAVVGTILAMLVGDIASIVLFGWVEKMKGIDFVASDYPMIAAIGAIGLFAAQLLLFVAYAALGDGSSVRRIIYSALVLFLFTSVLAVFSIWWFDAKWEGVVLILLLPMLFYFLLQVPLWGIRSWLGWIIISPWSECRERRQGRMRFSLAQMLGWSLFLGIPLCILRLIVNGTDGPIGTGPLLFCFWATILTLSSMWIIYVALGAKFRLWQSLLATTIVLLFAAVLQVTVWSFARGGLGYARQETIMVSIANLSAGLTMFACLRLAHRLDFRLLPFEARQRNSTVGLNQEV